MELKDWIREFVDNHTKIKNDKGKLVVDGDKLFALAEANNLDVKKYRGRWKSSTAGLTKMAISNMLRGAAGKRGGLKTAAGKTVKVPADLVKDDPTHNMDGTKIAKKKTAKAA